MTVLVRGVTRSCLLLANDNKLAAKVQPKIEISKFNVVPGFGQLLPTSYSPKEKRRLVNTPKGFSQVHFHVAMAPSFAII